VRSVFGTSLATDLEGLGQATRLGAKTDSRPDTSWNVERDGGMDFQEEYEGELGIVTAQARPKSLSNLADGKIPKVTVIDVPNAKRGPTRQVQHIAQSVQIVNPPQPIGMIAPIICMSEEFAPPPTLELPPKHLSYDGSGNYPSDISTATTEVPAHSTSSSRSDRKSWNPRGFITRFKDMRGGSEEEIVVPVNIAQDTHTSNVPLVHELTFAQVAPSDQVVTIPSPTTPVWEKPIPRPQTTTFEPFRFYDYRFSGVSDQSSVRASDSHTALYSDIDSGLGMSDSGSNAGGDEMPTLMAGAERRPETNKQDPNVKSKRDSQFVQPQAVADLPISRPYRESALRREVSMHEAFDFHPDLALQEDPPEDEGIVINFDLENPGPAPFQTEVEVDPFQTEVEVDAVPVPEEDSLEPLPTQLTQPAHIDSGEFARPSQVKRRTFDPRQLFSTPKLFSQKRNSVQPSSKRNNRNTISCQIPDTYTTSPSAKSTRPPSRSQPIIIMPHHQDIPLPSPPSQLYSSALPTKSVPSLPSTTHSSLSERPQTSRSRTTTHIPIIPKPPNVPAHEMAHMTPQSLALLREQEQLLVRRSTMQMTRTDQKAANVAYASHEQIGVAISSDATFMRPPMPEIPPKLAAHTAPLNHRPSVEFSTPSSRHDTKRSSSMAVPSQGFVMRLSPAAVSMVDLHKTAPSAPDINHVDNSKQRKKKWWKVWKRE